MLLHRWHRTAENPDVVGKIEKPSGPRCCHRTAADLDVVGDQQTLKTAVVDTDNALRRASQPGVLSVLTGRH